MNDEEQPRSEVITKLLNAESEDFQYAKNNIKNFIEKGDQALSELMDIAAQSQHPRAYEVLQKMIETLVKANQQLIETKKINNDIQYKPEVKGKTVNNLFVGSTAELAKMMEEKKKKDAEET